MQFLKNSRFAPWIVYLLATLPIFLPLLGSGFILVLDMVFAPAIPMPAEPTNTYPFYALLHIVNLIVPAFIIQKILLISIFTLAGVGAYKLLRALEPLQPKSTASNSDHNLWQWAAYVGGLFYMYNPFTYTRLMAGQYLVLLGYALLPFFTRILWNFTKNPSLKGALGLAAITTAIAVTSIHTLGIALIISLIIFGARIISRSGRKHLPALGVYSLAALAAMILLNSFWLIPVATGSSSLGNTVTNFSTTDFQAFATTSGELSITGNVLALQGFWGDDQNLYLLPSDVLTFWWLPVAILWALVLLGLIWSWRHQRMLAVIFGAVGLTGLILASGVNSNLFGAFNEWLATHISLFAGYRESQKFAMLLVIAYAYFITVGLFWLWGHLRSDKQRIVTIGFSFLLPLACAPLLLWGASGQLHAKNYPTDWSIANQAINSQKAKKDRALFLPWHLYMPMRFASGVTASPAESFFDIPVISSNDPELAGATAYKKDSDRKTISELLPSAADNPQFGTQLGTIGVRYVIVAKEFDYQKYDFLQIRTDMKRIIETPTINVYRIEKEN